MDEEWHGRAELTARGQRSRDRIVRSATRLMLEQGVNATSLDDVLAAAPASKSQLYHYFDGKHDLVGAVITAAADAVLAAQQPHLEALDSFEAIDAWFDHIVALKERQGCAFGCPLGTLTSELAATDETARARLVDAYARWQAHLLDGLSTMRASGALEPSADVEALAIATMASLQGGLLLAKAHRSVRPLRIALDAAAAHLRAFENRSKARRRR